MRSGLSLKPLTMKAKVFSQSPTVILQYLLRRGNSVLPNLFSVGEVS